MVFTRKNVTKIMKPEENAKAYNSMERIICNSVQVRDKFSTMMLIAQELAKKKIAL